MVILKASLASVCLTWLASRSSQGLAGASAAPGGTAGGARAGSASLC
jgi:hypothetical protein